MIDKSFLQYAIDILGETTTGLTSTNIVKLCNIYSVEYEIPIPYSSLPFPKDGSVPNKKTALLKNIEKFNPSQQFRIIKDLCENVHFKEQSSVTELKILLIRRFGHLNQESMSVNEELIEETKHWLHDYDKALTSYLAALDKYKNKIYERNLLDDLRLSLELLVKSILHNGKSLENQLSELGTYIKNKKGSKEFVNMLHTLIRYYTDYHNTYVKHNDNVIANEIDFILELTSSFMKHLVRINKDAH